MRLYLSTLGTIALSALIVSCGDLTGDDDNPAEEAKENTLALIRGINLMGEWKSECHETDLFDKAVISEYRFRGDDVFRSYRVFDDDSCKEDEIARITYSGEVEIRKADKKSDDYRELDLKYKKVVANIDSETGVDFFRLIDFCGYEKWTEDKDIDLTKASRRDGCPLADVPGNDYQLVKIDDKKLYFGDTGVKWNRSKDDRPNKIDKDNPFEKKD